MFLSTQLFDTHSFSEMHVRVEKLCQCRRNHRIKHVEIREIVSRHNRCDVRSSSWTWQSQLLWSSALWSEDRLFSDKHQSWSWLSSFEIPWSQEIFQDSIPKLDVSEIQQTTARKSSTNMIYHVTSTLGVVWRNWCIQRFFFHVTLSFPVLLL